MRFHLLSIAVALSWSCDRGTRPTPPPPPGAAPRVAPTGDAAPSNSAPTDDYLAGIPGEGQLVAELTTTHGVLRCELHEELVPRTVKNFVGLARGQKPWIDPQTGERVRRPLYDGLPFHRIVPGFVVQTGDPTKTGRGGPGFVFADEFRGELRHDAAGVMSMVNDGPNTNGSQFFITLAPAPHLDGRHTVFGACEPVEVLQALGSVEVDGDRPVDPPVLKSVTFSRRR